MLAGSVTSNKNLLVQRQQRKHLNNVWNLFKVNSEYTRRASLTHLHRHFSSFSSVSIADFYQVNTGWVNFIDHWNHYFFFISFATWKKTTCQSSYSNKTNWSWHWSCSNQSSSWAAACYETNKCVYLCIFVYIQVIYKISLSFFELSREAYPVLLF